MEHAEVLGCSNNLWAEAPIIFRRAMRLEEGHVE